MGIKKKPTCLDFFAGSGLVAEGLKDHFETIWANDICKKKAKVFCSNHDPSIFLLDSIENIDGKELPDAILSWGSFPCQDLSLAGNMEGISSSRSGLVWQWLRVMDEMKRRPPIVVAENVVGLVSSSRGENYCKLHEALVHRGYKVGAIILDASHWLPQSRKRVFVIGVDQDISTEEFEAIQPTWCHPSSIERASLWQENWIWWKIPKPQNRQTKLSDIVEFNAPTDENQKQKKLLSLIPEKHYEKLKTISPDEHIAFPGYKRIRNGRQVLELRFDALAGCLRTPEGGSSRQFLVIKNNGSLKTRLLTIKEVASLMGAPDTYQIPGSYNEAYKAMGDAVAVPVVRYLAGKLLSPIARKITDKIHEKN